MSQSNYVLAFHGGGMPETPEEGAKLMEKWQNWMSDLGDNLVNGGAPVGQSRTLSASGVTNDGGANPLSGYTIIRAESHEDAIEKAKGCPILESGGTIEIAPEMEM